MLVILICMLAGIAIGWLLRGHRERLQARVARATLFVVWTLLFLLGVEMGGNPDITSQLGTLGLEALGISLGAVIFCLFGAWGLWTWMKKGGSVR